MTTELIESVETQSINTKLLIGFLFIGAMVAPNFFSTINTHLSFDFGRIAGQMAMYSSLSYIVTYGLTKGKPMELRNRLMIIVGSLLLAYSILSSYGVYRDTNQFKEAVANLLATMDNASSQMKASNDEAEAIPQNKMTAAVNPDNKPAGHTGSLADFMNGAQPIVKRFADKSIDLNNRINALPVATVISPNNLTSPDGIVKSRTIIAEGKKLIAERGQLLINYWNEASTYFKTANIDEASRQAVLSSLLSGKSDIDRLYSDLDQVQLASLNEVSAIVDLAEKNMGELTVRDNKLLFPNQMVLDEYNLHMKNLLVASNEEAKATQAMQQLGQAKRTQIINDLGRMQ